MGDLWDGPGIAGLDEFELVGRGGFSVVYRARQVSLRRPVAVKLLLTDISDDKDVRRFQRECTILGQLGRHPHIVDVYDAGITRDRRPYIVMKLYERGTLATRVRSQGRLPVGEAVSILCDAADALQSAHDHSVVHRDIKLENLLIDDDGSIVLADFGVAALTDGRATMTTSMSFTDAYVAPEVLDGNHFGPASDIYALAATGYAMLTGNAPFHSTTGTQRLLAITTQQPEPITVPGVSAEVGAVLLGAMAKDPADRPGSAREFAAALRDALEGAPPQNVPPVPPVGVTPPAYVEPTDMTVVRHDIKPLDVAAPSPSQPPTDAADPTRVVDVNSRLALPSPTPTPSATSAPAVVSAPSQPGPLAPASADQQQGRLAPSGAGPKAGSARRGLLIVGAVVAAGLVGWAALIAVLKSDADSVNTAVVEPTSSATTASAAPVQTEAPPTPGEVTRQARAGLGQLKRRYPNQNFSRVQPATSTSGPWAVSIGGRRVFSWWWGISTQAWHKDKQLMKMKGVTFDRIKPADVNGDRRDDFLLLGKAISDGLPCNSLLINRVDSPKQALFRNGGGRYGAVYFLQWNGSQLISDYGAYNKISSPGGYSLTKWVPVKRRPYLFEEKPT